MAFEEEFKIEIADDDAEKARTIEDIIVYLAGRTKP
jgi:acyl carrier protein